MTKKKKLLKRLDKEAIDSKRQINITGVLMGEIRQDILDVERFLSEVSDDPNAVDPLLDLRCNFESQLEDLKVIQQRYKDQVDRINRLRERLKGL